MAPLFDVAIIGGGINGCGCAADAALRGLSVALFEQGDVASHTSSCSTKLIHGGLRYLEQYRLTMVKKALVERHTLLSIAPHLVQPQAFVLPVQTGMRPAWMLRLGLMVYDNLSAKNTLPKSQALHKKNHASYFSPLRHHVHKGFLYYDAKTQDARLTVANALLAKQAGALIATYSQVTDMRVVEGVWQLTIQPQHGNAYVVHAKTLINAAGPWAESLGRALHIPSKKISLVQGSHILVPALYEGNHAYVLQHRDQRIIFVIPYHGYSMVGTTETPFTGSLGHAVTQDQEKQYLVQAVNTYFKTTLQTGDIRFAWAGVRTLLEQAGQNVSQLSRDYYFELQQKPAPVVTIYSGKLTTYRQLAQELLDQLAPLFPHMKPCTTKTTPLPGGMDFQRYQDYATTQYQWLDPALLHRYLHTYGTCMEFFLSTCHSISCLGHAFGNGLYAAEVDYLLTHEFARTAEDILRRRTQLFLHMDAASEARLQEYVNARSQIDLSFQPHQK